MKFIVVKRLALASALAVAAALTSLPASAAPSMQAATPEAAADELAAALRASDFDRLQGLIAPSGFDWARSGSGGLGTMTPQQAVAFLRAQSGGQLRVTVQARPIGPSPVPWGPLSITSTWTNFGNVPQQSITLILEQSGGAWYWAGGFITATATPTPTGGARPTFLPGQPPVPTPRALPNTSTK